MTGRAKVRGGSLFCKCGAARRLKQRYCRECHAAAGRASRGWRSVSKPPKRPGKYLVVLRFYSPPTQHYALVSYYEDKTWRGFAVGSPIKTVTHWRPLPKLPDLAEQQVKESLCA